MPDDLVHPKDDMEDEFPYRKQPGVKRTRHKPTVSCENCRKKKIKCDRSLPCGPCKSRNAICQWLKGHPVAVNDKNDMHVELYRLRRVVGVLASRLDMTSDDVDTLAASLGPPESPSGILDPSVSPPLEKSPLLGEEGAPSPPASTSSTSPSRLASPPPFLSPAEPPTQPSLTFPPSSSSITVADETAPPETSEAGLSNVGGNPFRYGTGGDIFLSGGPNINANPGPHSAGPAFPNPATNSSYSSNPFPSSDPSAYKYARSPTWPFISSSQGFPFPPAHSPSSPQFQSSMPSREPTTTSFNFVPSSQPTWRTSPASTSEIQPPDPPHPSSKRRR